MQQQDDPKGSSNFEWVCQALSTVDEVCKVSATCHCPVCGKWFCALHAEDEAWHHCTLDATGEGARGKNEILEGKRAMGV